MKRGPPARDAAGAQGWCEPAAVLKKLHKQLKKNLSQLIHSLACGGVFELKELYRAPAMIKMNEMSLVFGKRGTMRLHSALSTPNAVERRLRPANVVDSSAEVVRTELLPRHDWPRSRKTKAGGNTPRPVNPDHGIRIWGPSSGRPAKSTKRRARLQRVAMQKRSNGGQHFHARSHAAP